MNSPARTPANEPAHSAIAVPTASEVLAAIMAAVPTLAGRLIPGTPTYQAFAVAARSAVVSMFGPEQHGPQTLSPFGSIAFPYIRMGAIDSLNLFDLDELIIFAFYWATRTLYHRVADVGSNVGLHSLLMARCGFEVVSYEPDPTHVELLRRTLSNNAIENVRVVQSAVSDISGEAEFVRLLGNTTGSHLAGAKPNPHGEIERFPVPLTPASEIFGRFDLVKVDAEGHEARILASTLSEQWDRTDAMVEIGSAANAAAVYEHCLHLQLHMFTQKTGWQRAARLEDVPTSYREGSAFMTRKRTMPGMNP